MTTWNLDGFTVISEENGKEHTIEEGRDGLRTYRSRQIKFETIVPVESLFTLSLVDWFCTSHAGQDSGKRVPVCRTLRGQTAMPRYLRHLLDRTPLFGGEWAHYYGTDQRSINPYHGRPMPQDVHRKLDNQYCNFKKPEKRDRELILAIVKMCNEGHSQLDVAKHFGVYRQYVNTIMTGFRHSKLTGIEYKPRKRRK